jgi:hypothetical protein
MSHCGTAQFTLKLAALKADLYPKRSVPPLKPQLGTFRIHGSENDGKKHMVQISPLAQVGE